MNRMFKSFDKLRKECSIAFLLTALLCLIVSLISELQFGVFITLNNFLKENYIFFVNLIFVYIILRSSKSKDSYNYYGIIVYAVCDLYYKISLGSHFSLVYSLIFALILHLIFTKLNSALAFCLSIFVGFLSTAFLVFLEPYMLTYVKHLAMFLSNKPSLFSVINSIYTLLFSDRLGDYIYSTGIGLSKIVNGEIITGVKSYFIYDTLKKDSSVSCFLSSSYIVNIFVSFGILLNLYNKIDDKSRISFLVVLASTIIGGNNIILSLFLLLLNPISYFSYLVVTFLSNAIVSMIDIRIGYINYPNIIELIKYIDKPIYFMIVGIIFIALTYFLFELVFKNMNDRNEFFLDKNSKRIITALGGLSNIDRFEDGVLFVKNPNLINILKIDCEIYNNRVILLENDIIVLKEYL